VERDRAGHAAAAVDWNVYGPALDTGRLARRQGDCGGGLAGRGQDRGDDEREEEATTHEARQGSSAPVRFFLPGIR
jgi:hypothetical protein